MRFTDSLGSKLLLGSAVWICAAALAAGPLVAAHEPGYGFYRTVEGDVRLTTLDRAEPLDVEPNYPLLLGDRVWVSPGARLEAVLPDQTILRADGGTDLYFEDLALYADDAAGEATILRLLEGEIQIVVHEYVPESQPVRVDTPNATIYLQQVGVYRIYADERQWTEVVVREGFGEVVLAEGSVVVRANEEAVVDGEVDPRVRVYPAGAYDALEAWGEELDRAAQLAESDGYVDESLHYQAAPLYDHGEWISVDAGYAWRPYVSVGWRPYTRGYWTYTPAGHYWVSAEPWSFTFHYGSWGLHPYHGWIWYPGSVFSPAWVTWYWGPTYVGWVPSGYYSHYYRYSAGLRFGFYGWAGGSWSYYRYWTFCPTRYFGWRSYGSAWRSGVEIARTADREIPRGVILGSTREIPRGYVGRPEYVAELHALAAEREARAGRRAAADVTEFVARRPVLSNDVREVVFGDESLRTGLRPTPSRPMVRAEEPRAIGSGRGPSDDRLSREVRSLPSRPDLSREELVTRPTARAPMAQPSRPMPSRPMPNRPMEVAPGRSVDLPPAGRPDSRAEPRPLPRFQTREPIRVAPGTPSEDRLREAPRAIPARPVLPARPITPTPRSLPPAADDAPPRVETRIPVVRRVLEGIRNHPPAPSRPPSSAPSSPRSPSREAAPSPGPTSRVTAPSPSSRPSASPPASTRRPPSSSVRRPSSSPPRVSKPSSSSSMGRSTSSVSRRGSSSSSSSKSGRSSASTRSQSRPKSKPPGD